MDKLPTVVIDGVRVELDDLHHEVIVHGRRRPLRPQAYFLARRLAVQWQACDAGQAADGFVSHAELCQEVHAPDKQALYVAVSDARWGLEPDLMVITEYGRGYAIRGMAILPGVASREPVGRQI